MRLHHGEYSILRIAIASDGAASLQVLVCFHASTMRRVMNTASFVIL